MRKNTADTASCRLTSGAKKHFHEPGQVLDKNVHNVQYVQIRYSGVLEAIMQRGVAMLERKERIFEEWKKFQDGEEVDLSVIRDFVYRSWLRCRALGVDPFRVRCRELSPAELAAEMERHAFLLESSKSIMEQVYSLISDSHSTISLATREGVILRSLPADNVVSARGRISREEYIGTVGLATCLEEKKQLEIFAAEHYCTENHDFVCSAAPIHDRNGDVVGVLGITSPCETFHPHTGGMLGAAVYAVMEQLGLRELLGEQKALLELMDEGVITLDAGGSIRLINAKAMRMLHLRDTPAGVNIAGVIRFSRAVAPQLEAGTAFHDVDTTLMLEDGARSVPCVLSAAVNHSTGGMILTLRETGRMREFATRLVGAKAAFSFSDIMGSSPRLQEALRKARKIAESDTTVLLLGESGTGKELFAQSLHNASPRRKKPFVVVNCGALPRELIQSELFGYTEGSFTGASRQGKPGKFELADGGTIFLDEIGEMPLDVQVNLLRLLQNREVVRIGGQRVRRVDIRIIAATNKNLYRAVQSQTFREDLYYRLNVFPLHIPPLRERQGDIALLARHFMRKFARQAGNALKDISEEALRALGGYSWPGNIRELENVMERAAYMAGGEEITLEDLPESVAEGACGSARAERSAFDTEGGGEEASLREALRASRGHIKDALGMLGMSRSTFYYKCRRYGIRTGDFRCSPSGPGGEGASLGRENPLAGLSAEELQALADLARRMCRKNGGC